MAVGKGVTFAGGLYAQCIMCLCFRCGGKLGQAKVSKLHVTARVIEDVGWLKILEMQMHHALFRDSGAAHIKVYTLQTGRTTAR